MTRRVGTDTSKFPGTAELGAIGTLEKIAALGLDGAFFRSPFELSPVLDAGELSAVADAAADLDLYLEVGVAKVNPFATPEAPQIRALGEGDYLRGMERIIRSVAAVGITELWTATANYQFRIRGIHACDRFRTDVDWEDQLVATAKVLDRLAPLLRDTGAHLNIETHEEISSFEVVRLVEGAGPDAFGITFDTANVMVRGEDPIAAARRVAPYTRSTHVRDVALHRTDDGIGRFLAPVGRGVIDWGALLDELDRGGASCNLSIEGVIGMNAEMPLFVDDPRWWAAHPDLTGEEFAVVEALTTRYEQSAAAGDVPSVAELRAPVDSGRALAFITDSAAALRAALAAREPATAG
ncbi:sugar phosphate isomerase/epimerase family protein [Microbacterium ureisolvens]|uniref:Sugar phosphate isomerase/epimerase n=1 Tax=Microbacterium ureisolvens TaxID=2781186 RepID=A0ABS7HT09_9MICO|nr:sugar phosphate isomerase/epimerase [Microbacterium ureisolvens]MBW9108491.1 sugar phosphate isomerase/epimerase [Microbacterium ureisolvens]